MKFTTEFKINLQSTKDEEMYMKKLYEIIFGIVPAENKVAENNNIDIKYSSVDKSNTISYDWRANIEEKDARKYTEAMESSLRSIKWLRKHCLRDIAFIYN